MRDRHLPAGVVGDRWTFELVAEFEENLHADITGFERDLREEVAEGEVHVNERNLQAEWRGRAESEAWKTGSKDQLGED